MARKVKSKWLGGRTDEDQDTRVKNYCAATEMDMGELVRKAVDEYMLNHPAKKAVPPPTQLSKPGGTE